MTFNTYAEIRAVGEVPVHTFKQLALGVPYTAKDSMDAKSDYVPDFEGWTILKQHEVYYSSMDDLDPFEEKVEVKPFRHYKVLAVREPDDRDGDVWAYLEYNSPDESEPSQQVTVQAASDNEEKVFEAIQHFTGNGRYVRSEDENEVAVGFWRNTRNGPQKDLKIMLAESWDDVRKNYAAEVSKGLDSLMELQNDQVYGKILLLHGPPGTGKTSCLRTLARAWQDWCDLEVVVDPEQMFNDANYLMSVLAENRDVRSDRWTMLILEDCDELIRKEAKDVSGQALSRLLNATDGFLGQGQNILIGITTNEPLSTLHPAVMRSGRCLSTLHVPALSADEARAWLDDPDLRSQVRGDMVLADLFALKNQSQVIRKDKEEATHGMYM